MAIPIEITTINPTKFVTPSSRYVNSNVILWGENKLLTFNTYKRTPIAVSRSDKFTVVPPGEEYRPDKTSRRAYGTPDFWWRILEANDIKDIFDYKAGLNVRIPSSLGIL